jgi:ankyrin repeat protein
MKNVANWTARYLVVILGIVFSTCADAQRHASSSDLRAAAFNGDVSEVRRLVAQGADPNERCPIVATIRRDNVDALLALVELGAKVDCKGGPDATPGYTALNMALAFPRVRSARALVAHGADVNAVPSGSLSPLESAVWNFRLIKADQRADWLLLIEELIQQGANVNYDSGTATVLGTALLDCRTAESVVPLLLKYGADPNQPTGESPGRTTPLQMALGGCSDNVVRNLLEKGAKPSINGDASAIVQYARVRHREALIPLLIQHGAVQGDSKAR